MQRAVLKHDRHVIDVAVARGTADPFVHVNAMVEIDVDGKIMNALPDNGVIVPPAIADGLENLGVVPDDRMAGHAGLGGRKSRET